VKSQNNFYQLVSYKTGEHFTEEQFFSPDFQCDGPVDMKYDYEYIKKRLNTFALQNAPISALKYLDFYPINDLTKVVSLKEGGTPLYHAQNLGKELGLEKLFVKNEGANPTGVFKDRGTLTEVTKALEIGAKAVCIASSGNMAASVSAYCALAKIPCYVLVPESTPIGKLVQINSYGGIVMQIRGDYSTCVAIAEIISKKNNYYLAGDYVYRREGQKSCAYEIVEQLNWKAPDYVMCPVGCGTNFAAVYKGFKEFHQLGFIDRMPRMIGIQPVGCNPVVEAYNKKMKGEYIKIESTNTVCSAVAVANPLDGAMVLDGIYDTDGAAFEITDVETLEAQRLLANSEGIFTEPSGALSISGLQRAISQLKIPANATVVSIACGNGLKDPLTVVKHMPLPPTMAADWEEVQRFINSPLCKVKKVNIGNLNKLLWEKAPEKEKIAEIIIKEFDINLEGELLDQVVNEVGKFDRRGKHIREVDLKGIVENVLKDFSGKKPAVRIIDYQISAQKEKRVQANAVIEFLGQEIKAHADGVGPVDALINALRKSIKNHPEDIECALTDYRVSIKTQGTASAVDVEIDVTDKFDHKVVGSATSPDIIEASIEAFIKAYNALYWRQKSRQ
jgi:threonine synthase